MLYTEKDLISFAVYRNKYGDPTKDDYKNILEALIDWREKYKITITIPCGDCGKILPPNMECNNPECVRVIMKNKQL